MANINQFYNPTNQNGSRLLSTDNLDQGDITSKLPPLDSNNRIPNKYLPSVTVFNTKAEMESSPNPRINDRAIVLNDPMVGNNGEYIYVEVSGVPKWVLTGGGGGSGGSGVVDVKINNNSIVNTVNRQASLTVSSTQSNGVWLNFNSNDDELSVESQLASGTDPGTVTLSDSTSSTNSSADHVAATPVAVKSAYDLANSKISGVTFQGNDASITATLPSFSIYGSGPIVVNTPTDSNKIELTIKDSTTAQKGAVQLNDTVTSTSTVLGATANAVKTAYDTAQNKIQTILFSGNSGSTASYNKDSGDWNIQGTDGITTISGNGSSNEANLEIKLDVPTAKTVLGLGSAAYLNTGTSSGNIPVLDGSGKLENSVIPSLAITHTYVYTGTGFSLNDVVAWAVTQTPKPEQGDIIIVNNNTAIRGQYYVTTPALSTPDDLVPAALPAGAVDTVSINGSSYTPVNGIVTLPNLLTNVTSSTDALTVSSGGVGNATLTISNASTSSFGLVKLSDSTSTLSSTTAATSTAVKSAYDLASSKLSTISIAFTKEDGSHGEVNTKGFSIYGSGPIVVYGQNDSANLSVDLKYELFRSASTTQTGITLLSDSISSPSSTTSATSKAVYDVAMIANNKTAIKNEGVNVFTELSRSSSYSYGPDLSTGNQTSIATTGDLSNIFKNRLFLEEVTFTSSAVTSTSPTIAGTYKYTYSYTGGSQREKSVRIMQVILSNGIVAIPQITYNDEEKSVTLTFYDPSDTVANVYGGVFNTSTNVHTLVLAKTYPE